MRDQTRHTPVLARAGRHGAAAGLALLLLTAGCVDTTAPQAAAPAPSPAPVSADPSIEPVTGIAKDALLAVQGMPDMGQMLYLIFYYPAKVDPAQLRAAPARLCANRGLSLVSSEDKALEHPEEMPGVRKYVIRCK